MRVGVVGLQRQRLAQGLDRLLVAAEGGEHRAAIVVRLGEFRFLLQRLVEARNRLVAAVERVQDHAVIEQNLRRGPAQRHRLRHQTKRLDRLALGVLHDGEHLQCVEVLGPYREDRGIEPFGLGQPALFVKPQRLGEGLRHIQRSGLRRGG